MKMDRESRLIRKIRIKLLRKGRLAGDGAKRRGKGGYLTVSQALTQKARELSCQPSGEGEEGREGKEVGEDVILGVASSGWRGSHGTAKALKRKKVMGGIARKRGGAQIESKVRRLRKRTMGEGGGGEAKNISER